MLLAFILPPSLLSISFKLRMRFGGAIGIASSISDEWLSLVLDGGSPRLGGMLPVAFDPRLSLGGAIEPVSSKCDEWLSLVLDGAFPRLDGMPSLFDSEVGPVIGSELDVSEPTSHRKSNH